MIRRLEEVIWVVDYLDDLDADFLRFYGVDDMYDLPSARFFKLATRTMAYGGVMTNRVQAENEKAQKRTPGARTKARNPGAKEVPLSGISEFID